MYQHLDYANDATRHDDKLTYLSPVFSGFQVGASYTPSVDNNDGSFPTNGGTNTATPEYTGSVSRTFGNGVKPGTAYFGSAYEGAARWEGTFRNVGLNIGGGYTHVTAENKNDPAVGNFNSLNQFNGAIDANIAAFGLGGGYTKDSGGNFSGSTGHTYFAGTDYTTGPVKFGASYLHNKTNDATIGNTFTGIVNAAGAVNTADVKTNRYSVGAVYTFAPA